MRTVSLNLNRLSYYKLRIISKWYSHKLKIPLYTYQVLDILVRKAVKTFLREAPILTMPVPQSKKTKILLTTLTYMKRCYQPEHFNKFFASNIVEIIVNTVYEQIHNELTQTDNNVMPLMLAKAQYIETEITLTLIDEIAHQRDMYQRMTPRFGNRDDSYIRTLNNIYKQRRGINPKLFPSNRQKPLRSRKSSS